MLMNARLMMCVLNSLPVKIRLVDITAHVQMAMNQKGPRDKDVKVRSPEFIRKRDFGYVLPSALI